MEAVISSVIKIYDMQYTKNIPQSEKRDVCFNKKKKMYASIRKRCCM